MQVAKDSDRREYLGRQQGRQLAQERADLGSEHGRAGAQTALLSQAHGPRETWWKDPGRRAQSPTLERRPESTHLSPGRCAPSAHGLCSTWSHLSCRCELRGCWDRWQVLWDRKWKAGKIKCTFSTPHGRQHLKQEAAQNRPSPN